MLTCNNDGKKAWETLNEKFERTDYLTLQKLRQELWNYRMHDGTELRDYLMELETKIANIERLEATKFTTIQKIGYIIGGLPSS